MFLFSLGTVPLMLGLGSIVSALGKRFTQKIMTIGAFLVVVLGLAMVSQGVSLSGFLSPNRLLLIFLILGAAGLITCLPFKRPIHKNISTLAALCVAILLLIPWNLPGVSGAPEGNPVPPSGGAPAENQIVDGRQVVTSDLSPGRYPDISVKVGMPVKWIIQAADGSINGCNNRMFIQAYGIEHAFKPGENIIEFTPTEAGTIYYSCWMGMIQGTITASA